MRWYIYSGFPGENLAPATDVTAAEVIHHGNAIGTHPASDGYLSSGMQEPSNIHVVTKITTPITKMLVFLS